MRGFLESDLDPLAQVSSVAGPDPEGSQDVAENPVDAAEVTEVDPGAASGAKGRRPIPVVGRALLGIAEDLISRVELAEPSLGVGVAGVLVGVVPSREPPKGRLQLRVGRVSTDFENLVRIAHPCGLSRRNALHKAGD
jgi:hypothetical protein